MSKQNQKDYTFQFESSETPQNIFNSLLDVRSWWSGLFGEEIKGNSKKINDEFTFRAGDGIHYSKQRLTELLPYKKITWLVTESNLTFLKQPDEWTGTKIGFEISAKGNKTQITFTHAGLAPEIECYDSCSDAWTKYLKKLAEKLD